MKGTLRTLKLFIHSRGLVALAVYDLVFVNGNVLMEAVEEISAKSSPAAM
jgi:hypothetical protein